MQEKRATIDKLREMQAGNVVLFTSEEMRILKTLDRSNEIRSRPSPTGGESGVDGNGLMWSAWFEWQTLHEADLQQITGRLPQGGDRSELGRSTREIISPSSFNAAQFDADVAEQDE